MKTILICKDRETNEVVELKFTSSKKANEFKRDAFVFWERFYLFDERKLTK